MVEWNALGERKTMCPCGHESYRPEPVAGRRAALRCIGCHRTTGRCTCPFSQAGYDRYIAAQYAKDVAAPLPRFPTSAEDLALAIALRAWLDSHGEAEIEERLADAAKAWLNDD
jgi:hypothetical protein